MLGSEKTKWSMKKAGFWEEESAETEANVLQDVFKEDTWMEGQSKRRKFRENMGNELWIERRLTRQGMGNDWGSGSV